MALGGLRRETTSAVDAEKGVRTRACVGRLHGARWRWRKGGARRAGSAGGAGSCCDTRCNKAKAVVVVVAAAATSRESDRRTARDLGADARRVDSKMVKDEDMSQIDCGRTYSGRVT